VLVELQRDHLLDRLLTYFWRTAQEIRVQLQHLAQLDSHRSEALASLLRPDSDRAIAQEHADLLAQHAVSLLTFSSMCCTLVCDGLYATCVAENRCTESRAENSH
jgi:hypothetical protein